MFFSEIKKSYLLRKQVISDLIITVITYLAVFFGFGIMINTTIGIDDDNFLIEFLASYSVWFLAVTSVSKCLRTIEGERRAGIIDRLLRYRNPFLIVCSKFSVSFLIIGVGFLFIVAAVSAIYGLSATKVFGAIP